MAKKVGNVASAPKRADEGKARPSAGSSKVGDKWGWIPAAAGEEGKHHPNVDGTKDSAGVHESGKGNRHSHQYGRHPQDTRKNGIAGPSK
jgi:hypothetical protein